MDDRSQAQRAFQTVIQDCTLMQLAGAPSGSYLDSEGLPHLMVDGVDLCSVQYSSHGEVFHSSTSRCAGARYHTHLLNLTPCAPCRVCQPAVPNLHWYNRLLSIVLALSEYDVPLPHIALSPNDHLTAEMVSPILPDSQFYEEPSPWEFNLALPILQNAIAAQQCTEDKPTLSENS